MTWIPDQPREGFWMLRCCRLCPFVAARIYTASTTADPVSGDPMDRSPFLAAQIGLDIVGWREVWFAVQFVESSPEQQAALINPPLSDRAPRNGRAPAFKTAPMALWKRERARGITGFQYEQEIFWLRWAARNKPDHPDFNFRKPVDLKAAAVPKWADRERFA